MDTFPKSFEELTVEFLNKALHSKLPEIKSFTKSTDGIPQGFTGDVFRINITYKTPTQPNPPYPSTLILKFATTNPGINALLTDIKGYLREITLYPILNAHPQLHTPILYASNISSTNSTFIMILEDLQNKQLHRGNHEVPLDFALATRIVDYFAYMNAIFWNCHLHDNFKQYLSIGNNDFPAYMQNLTRNMYTKRLDAFIERNKTKLNPQILDTLRTLDVEKLYALTKPNADYTNIKNITLVHGDPQPSNLMYNDSTLTMIDWAYTGIGKGCKDVILFLGICSDSTTMSKEQFEELKQRYYTQLIANGVNAETYTQEEFNDDWKNMLYISMANIISTSPEENIGDDEEKRKAYQRYLDYCETRFIYFITCFI